MAYINEYGTFRYGTQKYGPNAETIVHPHWAFQVAWDGTYGGLGGSFNNEALVMTNLHVTRGRANYISGTSFAPIDTGRATLTLDNADGRYDPLNTSSPLYPYVAPGKFARLWLWEPKNDEPYFLMRGIVSDIVPIGGPRAKVLIKIVDGFQWLKDLVGSKNLLNNTKYYWWVTYMLLAAGWPQAEWPILSAGTGQLATTIWAWNENILDYIKRLAAAEVGLFFHAANGYSKFYTRDYSQALIATITEAEMQKDPVVRYSWESIRNVIQVVAHWFDYAEPPVILWDVSGQEIFIESGETLVFLAEFLYNGQNVGGIALGTNLEVNTQPDASGADITANCSLGTGGEGGGTTVTLTNNDAQDGYIIVLNVTGGAYQPRAVTTIEKSDTNSIAAYGRKTLLIDSDLQQDPGMAGCTWIAEDLLAELKDPRPLPVFQLEDRLDIQFKLDLFNKIKLEIPTLGVDDYFRVGQIDHQWTVPTGVGTRTTITCEPYFEMRVL